MLLRRASGKPLLPLYLRLWLAVVATVAVLTLLVGAAWRLAADPPLREAVVRAPSGEVLGTGRLRPRGVRAVRPPEDDEEGGRPEGRRGPEFIVTMQDGRTLLVHLPRPIRSFWNRPPFGFFWTLGLVALAMALGTYPIIRKLTRRLEHLQQGVEQWGRGDLSARVQVQGVDEVAFLARRFNHAAERVGTLVKTHKSLLANASHELRSPLTRIRMGLELMGNPGAGASSDAAATALRDEIARNITELDQLIDEILLASRLDAQEADVGTMESIDIAGLAAEECARVGAELHLTDDAVAPRPGGHHDIAVCGVPKLLRRALRNLLENARRYSRGDIDVLVLSTGGRAEVRVCDRGPGVPEAERERIFEPFYRLAGASEREGSVGLGLALVRSIAVRHGGTVRCEAREGGGAAFVLSLPLEAHVQVDPRRA